LLIALKRDYKCDYGDNNLSDDDQDDWKDDLNTPDGLPGGTP